MDRSYHICARLWAALLIPCLLLAAMAFWDIRMNGLNSLAHPLALVTAAYGGWFCLVSARYWRQAAAVPAPVDAPAADADTENDPLIGDEIIPDAGGLVAAVIRRRVWQDGRVVWYRTGPPPAMLNLFPRRNSRAARSLPERAGSFYDRAAAIAEARAAVAAAIEDQAA